MGFIRDILVLSAALLSRAPHPSSPFLSPSSPLHDPRDEERKWSWDGGGWGRGGEREIHMASGNVPEIFLLQFYQISVSLFRNVFFPRRRSMISSGRKRAQIQNLNRCDFLRSKGTRANSPCVRPRLPYFFAVNKHMISIITKESKNIVPRAVPEKSVLTCITESEHFFTICKQNAGGDSP